jgi:hypothetical protein
MPVLIIMGWASSQMLKNVKRKRLIDMINMDCIADFLSMCLFQDIPREILSA